MQTGVMYSSFLRCDICLFSYVCKDCSGRIHRKMINQLASGRGSGYVGNGERKINFFIVYPFVLFEFVVYQRITYSSKKFTLQVYKV